MNALSNPPSPMIDTRALFQPSTFNAKERTIQAIVSTGAPVVRPGFTEVLDLSGADLSALIGGPVLDGHKRDTTRDQLGVIEAARVTGEGLLVTIRFRENPAALAVMTDVANGTLRGLSIGYSVEKWSDGKDASGKVRTAKNWTPKEVSIVPVPADPGAHFRNGESRMENLEDTKAVQTRATQNAEIRTLATLAGLTRDWADAQIDAQATPEAARAAALTEKARVQAATRTSAVQITADNSDPAVIATRAGEAIFARSHPAHQVSPAARQYVGMTMPDHARESLRRAGVPVQGLSTETLIARALTTSDFPLILGDAVGRELRTAYQAAPSGLRAAAKQSTVRDFRAKSKLMLGAAATLERVPESGEFPYGAINESGETYSAKTYGKIFSISRQALVNDDLGAFTDLPARMGAAAAEFENGLLVTMLTSNPAMSDTVAVFHANHGNLAGAAAPSVATLTAARLAMRKQVGLAGEPVNSTPKYLIVPPDYETVGEQVLTTLNATALADANPFPGKLTLLVEPRLTTATQWYLAADPGSMDGLEYAYLEGAPGPQIETRNGFEVDGMQVKVRLDFACGWVDYRGWQRVG